MLRSERQRGNKQMKKILAIAGSNSSSSINKSLLNIVSKSLNIDEVMDIRQYDDLPIYNPDLEKQNGIPRSIEALYQKMQTYDAFIIATPEHNGFMPAAFKNVIDWLSRIDMKFLGQKPTLLLSTSPGPRGGQNVLNTLAPVMPYWGAKLTGTFGLGNFYKSVDLDQQKIETEEAQKLALILNQFTAANQLQVA